MFKTNEDRDSGPSTAHRQQIRRCVDEKAKVAVDRSHIRKGDKFIVSYAILSAISRWPTSVALFSSFKLPVGIL